MSRQEKRAITAAVKERDRALAAIRARKAELEPHVREEVKEATRALIDRYKDDLRELAKH